MIMKENKIILLLFPMFFHLMDKLLLKKSDSEILERYYISNLLNNSLLS
jgi:hypothetical protein